MNIVFDAFLLAPDMQDDLSAEEEIFYAEFTRFMEQRLNPLKEKIEAIERVNPNSFICINFAFPKETLITPFDYPASLAERMLDCFSLEDLTYLDNIIARRLDSFGDGI